MAKKTARPKRKIKKTKSKAKPPKPPVTPERLMQMAWGFAPMLMLKAAVDNRLFDELATGPKTAAELAGATQCSPRGTLILAEGLLGFGLLKRRKDRFSLAPDAAAFMVSGKPGYLGGMLKHFAAQLLDNWRQLPQIVRTGQPATMVDHQDQGAEFFSQFVEDLFHMSFHAADTLAIELLKKPPTHNGVFRILDIAAGSGVWSIPIASRMPNSHITAVDFAKVLPVTRRIVGMHHPPELLSTIEGDIQTVDFGSGFQVATLGHILHSEGEAKSRNLLKKVFDALAPGGMIAIAEFIPDDDRSGPPQPLMFAVNMLVHTEAGDTFTFKQMKSWLHEIGFHRIKKIPVPSPSPIVVAQKP